MRYDIKHPVINDNEFLFWRSQGVNCWPTVMVFSPDAKPLLKVTGEGSEEQLGAILVSGLETCAKQIEAAEGTSADWINFLNANVIPL